MSPIWIKRRSHNSVIRIRIIKAPCHEDIWESRGIASYIVNVGARIREWSASHLAASSAGKGPRDPLDRRLSGSHGRCAHCEKRNLGLCQEHTNYYKTPHYAIFSDLPLHFSFWTKYSGQHSVQRHPKWRSFTTIQNKKNYFTSIVTILDSRLEVSKTSHIFPDAQKWNKQHA